MDEGLGMSQIQKLRTGEVSSCDINVNYVLALGSREKTVSILEWKTGLGFVDMFYSPLHFHKYAVTSVRFSPKGTILASGSLDGTAILIDVLTGTKIFTAVQDNTANIKFCEFSFDSTKLITAAEDGVLCFWDVAHRRQMRRCRLHEDDHSLRGFAVSPDSEYLLSMDSGNFLKVWFIGDVIHKQAQCLFLRKNIHDDVLCCEFSPVKSITSVKPYLKLNYSIATCGIEGWMNIWEVEIERKENRGGNADSFKCELKLVHHLRNGNDILSVRFNSVGSYIVGTGLDNLVTLWEVQSGKCIGRLRGHGRYVTSAAFSRDSVLLATGSIDKTLIIWALSKNLTLDSELLTPCNASCHFTNINVINYHAGNIAADQEKKYTEFIVFQKLSFSSIINSVRFQGNDGLAVAGGQKAVEIWKREREKLQYVQRETLKEHESSVNDVDAAPCGEKIISCSADGMMIFWDLNTNLTYKVKIPNSAGSLRTCKFSPDSKFIVVAGDDQKVYLWDANNLEFLKVTQENEDAVSAVAFTPEGELLVSACGSDIILHNFQQNKLIATINNAHDLGVLCCDFSSATPSHYECSDDDINSSGDNRGMYNLATGGNDSLVKLWKVSVSEIFGSNVLSGHGGPVNCVQFSSAEPFVLASGSSDSTVRIWDTKTQHCLQVLNYHQRAVITCSFSKDSTLLATGSLDKSVFILSLTTRLCHVPKESSQNSNKLLENWSPEDIGSWFLDVSSPEVADKIQERRFGGRELLSIGDDSLADLFELTSEKEQKQLKAGLSGLKKSLGFPSGIRWEGKDVPHKFLCPITHLIMKDPVICTDGYTYDRSAITEWFLSGKLFSPITKECLTTTKLLPYPALKINIYQFLDQTD